jgi:hypothetical protein
MASNILAVLPGLWFDANGQVKIVIFSGNCVYIGYTPEKNIWL